MTYLVTDVFPEVRRSAQSCPDITIQDAVLRAARLFCQRSWYVIREISITMVPSQPDYLIVPTSNQEEVIGCQYVQVNGPPGLGPVSHSEAQDPNRALGPPMAYSWMPLNKLTLFPTPDIVYPNTFGVFPVQPVRTATNLPDEILQKHHETIGYGALAYVQEMAGNPWFNPQLAALNYARFNALTNNAKGEAMRAWMARNLAVRKERFVAKRIGVF